MRTAMLLLAHPTSLAGLIEGLDAGVDVFVHTTLGEEAAVGIRISCGAW
jgi:hypothetical protein